MPPDDHLRYRQRAEAGSTVFRSRVGAVRCVWVRFPPMWVRYAPCGCHSPGLASRDLRLRGPFPGEWHPHAAKGTHTQRSSASPQGRSPKRLGRRPTLFTCRGETIASELGRSLDDAPDGFMDWRGSEFPWRSKAYDGKGMRLRRSAGRRGAMRTSSGLRLTSATSAVSRGRSCVT